MHISATHRHFISVCRKFELVDKVYHPIMVDQDVEIGSVFDGQHILFLCFEIQHRKQRTLDGLCAIYVHREIF